MAKVRDIYIGNMFLTNTSGILFLKEGAPIQFITNLDGTLDLKLEVSDIIYDKDEDKDNDKDRSSDEASS